MNSNEHNNNVKDRLLDELEELIYQCKNRFSNRYELATENEIIVSRLCLCLEQILNHGLRNNTKTNKLLNGILSGSGTVAPKNNINFWTFIKQFLTEHETQRFLLLRCVQTDNGRSCSWIRNALNEHSIERYMNAILIDKRQYRSQYYHEWALLCDTERSSQFVSHLGQLNSILFALNIDNADLDDETVTLCYGADYQSQSQYIGNKAIAGNHGVNDDTSIGSHTRKKDFKDGQTTITTTTTTPAAAATAAANTTTATAAAESTDCKQLLVPNSSKRSHFVTINDSNESYNDSDNESYARSAPNPCFLDSASCFTSTVTPSTSRSSAGPSKVTQTTSSTTPTPKIVTERSSLPAKSSSSTSLNVTDSGMVLFPICDQEYENTTSEHHHHHQEPEANADESSRKRLVELESERDKLDRENTLLKIQLKKYIAAIELLKFNRIVAEETAKSDDEPTNENSQNFIRDYENKLVKVSQMHGELVEFNDYLYKVIQQKDSIIARLRDELVELRGPLPDTDDIMSTSGDGEHQSSLQSLVQIPLIHVWIPTAFLSGGFKGKSHHIYQIYIRIKEEEWNVYRRYSQFYSLHKTLKSTHRQIAEFEFPPKKAIGNKDSKVVQERRKKLEFYLRNVINHIQSLNSDITNKEKLVQAIPFLSDKFFLQDRSHSETNLTQPSQSTTTQPYMGF